MDHFNFKNGALHAEDVALAEIADAVGTPFYCYSTATLSRHYTVFAEAFAKALPGIKVMVCYAVKANSNVAVIRLLAALGAGADVVSGGELVRALRAGVAPERIVFSGIGKGEAELRQAIKAGIAQVNVESESELEVLSAIAAGQGVRVPIAVRVNPDVDARTHAKITTGKSENKFGIDIARAPAVYARAAQLPGVSPVGIAVHIGSQLLDLDPFRAAYGRVRTLCEALRADGIDIRRLDLGGGLGIPYERDAGKTEPTPSPAAYAAATAEVFGGLDCEVVLEPGRVIVGNAGVLVSRVVNVKDGESRRFIIVDAAMNDLIRPALYDAHHAIECVLQPDPGRALAPVDVVGPVCETGDTFARGRLLPNNVITGDLLAFRSAGAYSAVMASTYNSRPLVPEVLVDGNRFAVIRRRMEIDDMLALERMPDWMAD